jgi:dihydropteroate synthase
MGEQTFTGLDVSRPLVMGIVNVTPDSFSDGGDAFQRDHAIAHGFQLIEQGADIVDIGGESTRPGADPVDEAEEIARVVPVVQALAETSAVVSIDTRHAAVMEAAIQAGAKIVNDVTALEGDVRSLDVVAAAGVSLCLMHMQGEPQTMQKDPTYSNVVGEIHDYLNARVEVCEARGIKRSEIAIDPGIGFGKTVDHNLTLMNELSAFGDLGCPVLLGLSRKSFIAKLSSGEDPKDRLAGSLAGALAGLERGANILRVHDVAETCQAIAVWQAISQGGQAC